LPVTWNISLLRGLDQLRHAPQFRLPASPTFTLEYRSSSPELTSRRVKSKLLDHQGYPAARWPGSTPKRWFRDLQRQPPSQQNNTRASASFHTGYKPPSSGSTESSNAAPTSSASPAAPPCRACRPACSLKPTTDGKTATAATCPNSPWLCSRRATEHHWTRLPADCLRVSAAAPGDR